MAAAGARFSIREYAAQARAAGGSWPFGGEAGGALPPMEVPRFRWWAGEAAAVEEEEREVERRMAAKRRKRSVAELFAAVPRVAGGQGKRAVSGVQAKKGKLVLAVEVKASKGLKKKATPIGPAFSKKEKIGSVKATSVSISPLFQDSIRKRKMTKYLGKKKRNQGASLLLDKRSKKEEKISFLNKKKNATKNDVQAQSKLNKQSKVGFSTVLDNTDVTCKLKSSCKPKHVTFSHDIFESTVPLPENNTEQPQTVQTSRRPSQEGFQLAYQDADSIPVSIEDTSLLSEIVVSTGVCCTSLVAKPKERTVVRNSVDRKHCTEISNSSHYLNSISLAYLPRKMPSQNLNGLDSHLDNDEYISLDVECLGEKKHVIPHGSSNPVSLAVKAISDDTCRSLSSQPSSSCLDDRMRSSSTARMITNHHQGKFHHKFISFGKDVMNGISSSSGSKKPSDAPATDCVAACRNKYLRDDYVGLPLNSLGEFVKLHPGGTPSSVDISKRQNLGDSSRPSAFPACYTRTIYADNVNLKPSHHVPNIHTTDQPPHFTPAASTEMDFRQLPCPERMDTHKHTIPSNKCPFNNLQELSTVCSCSQCAEFYNPQRKPLGLQSCFMHQDCEQNTQPIDEATMRLMGKTVTLGTSSKEFRDLNSKSPNLCKQIPIFFPKDRKQIPIEDRSFQGTYRKAFPQLFHWEMVDPPSALMIPHGERELSENLSLLSFVPAAELRSGFGANSFRTDGYSQKPILTATNNPYVQPATWCNEGELQHQQPVMTNQVQSHSEDMLLFPMHRRNNENVAPTPYFHRRNSIRNFMEKRLVPYQPGYFTQKFRYMTQRNPMPSSLSGYAAVQSNPGLTTQTKFTSLPPLPPSLAPSHVYTFDYAQHRGSNAISFDPSIPEIYQASKSSAPGNDISREERLKWAMMGSNVDRSEHGNCNGKRPADKDDALLTPPKKPCHAARTDNLNSLPVPGRGGQFCGSRPDAQPVAMPVGFRPMPGPDLRLENRDARTTWTANTITPIKLESGARHVFQPSGSSSTGQDILWTVNSAPPFAVENGACTASTSKNRDTEPYKV